MQPPAAANPEFVMLAVMLFGPDLPTELSRHNLCHLIFMAAAQYVLSEDEITTVLSENEITTACMVFFD
jgi:hypothetical protein